MRSNSARARLAGFLVLSVVAAAPQLHARGTLIEAWADPVNGNDGSGLIGSPTHPFRTLNEAILQVSFAVNGGSPTVRGRVIAQPGIYSAATNGEQLPIAMTDGVDVQGVGARRCVIRGNGTQQVLKLIWPTQPTGKREFRECLVDFTCAIDVTIEETIDGFTFQGGDIQVYVETEGCGRIGFTEKNGRVSNCVFDLRAGGDDGLYGPSFGVLMGHTYNGLGYDDIKLNILNNTFIQGWDPKGEIALPAPGSKSLAILDNVGICDVNEPIPDKLIFPGSLNDPIATLRGVGNPSVQNNLIRCLPGGSGGGLTDNRTAMLGIDASDTRVVAGFVFSTNCFAQPLAAQATSVGGKFKSSIVGGMSMEPTPRVELFAFLGGSDPDFVGEMLSLEPAPIIPTAHLDELRDWRLLPDSSLVDQGRAPVAGVLTAANMTAYIQDANFPQLSSFDWDGEGHGNLRVTGANVDIGYDESSLLVIAGSYGNESASHNLPWDSTIATGQPRRYMISPTTAPTFVYYTAPLLSVTSWMMQPGTLTGTVQTIPGLTVPAPWNVLYLDPAQSQSLFGAPQFPLSISYTNPRDGTPHSFGLIAPAINESGTPARYFNEQAVQATGPTEVKLSNLQSEYL